MNEAAIFAARRDLKEISKEEIADALERIVAGPEKKGAVMSEHKKKLVAYHEVLRCSCSYPVSVFLCFMCSVVVWLCLTMTAVINTLIANSTLVCIRRH